MSDSPWHEQAIAAAVQAGDPAAWRTLFDSHYEPLAAYVRWRCAGLTDLADDVLQEAWLTAVRRVSSFDPAKGRFFDWLCGIASNAARSAVRARCRRNLRVRALVPGEEVEGPNTSDALDQAERVAVALSALPEHYEAVLRAKYLDRLTVDEIAQARGDSVKAVESLLARARTAFRDAIEKSDD